ncbi:MAG: hypothetical protein ACREM8_10155, partial [Vulcanimicrobiaceae bacterium]
DQTVGANPFDFFGPKIGVSLAAGNPRAGTSAIASVFEGHDKQSGIAAFGLDRDLLVQHAIGPLTLSAYRYDGARPVVGALDRFWRQGFGAGFASGRVEFDNVLQRGRDGNADRLGNGASSSGGFSQLRFAISARVFGLMRYEGTQDPSGFARDLVVLAGFRPTRNARFTVEDVISHAPTTKHTVNAQYTVGY